MTRTPHGTTADVAKWRRLVREASVVAVNVGHPLGDLKKATDAARRAVVPSGVIDKSNVFVRLVRASQKYLAETAAGQTLLVADLAMLADLARQALDPPRDLGSPLREPNSRLPYRDE